MKRGMIAGLLVLLTSAAAFAIDVPFPFKTFSGSTEYAQGAQLATCGEGKELFLVRLALAPDAWAYLAEITSGRIMVFYYKGDVEGAVPDAVGVGQVDMVTEGQHDVFPSLTWYTLDEAKARWASPCSYLFVTLAATDRSL